MGTRIGIVIEQQWRNARQANRITTGLGGTTSETLTDEPLAVKHADGVWRVLQYRIVENPLETGLQDPIWTEWQDVPIKGMGLPQWAEAMAEAMKRIDEKWTSVDDGLPEEEGVYLCYFSDGTIETFDYQSEDQRNLWGVGPDLVTHWMPLPRPPTIRNSL